MKIERNLVLVPIKNCGYSWVGFFMSAGSRYETAQNHGVAHLLEHIFMRQAATGYYDIDAETQAECMMIRSRQLPEDTAVSLANLANIIFKHRITPEDFEKERPVLSIELSEVGMSQDHLAAFAEIFGADSPYTLPAGGSIDSIASLSPEAVGQFRRDFVRPERAVCVVAGDFDEVEIRKMTAKLNFSSQLESVSPPGDKPSTAAIQVVSTGDLVTARFFFPLPPISDFDSRLKIMLMRACLAGYPFSLLNRSLRHDQGLAYTIESETKYYSGGGYLQIGYTTPSSQAKKAAESVQQLIGTPSLFTEELVQQAKQRIILELKESMMNPEAVAWWYGEDLLLTGSFMELAEVARQVGMLTRADILQTASTYIQPPLKIIKF